MLLTARPGTHKLLADLGPEPLGPEFTAEHFDPEEWAELFEQTGARFAGPVAEHHDGFSMWASEVTPWNAGARGPKRDITGELAKAIRKHGLAVECKPLWDRQLARWVEDEAKRLGKPIDFEVPLTGLHAAEGIAR